MAMSMDVDSSCDRMNRQAGHGDQSRWTALASIGTELFVLPVVGMVGLVTWEMLSALGTNNTVTSYAIDPRS
jgi:hypothetical protein